MIRATDEIVFDEKQIRIMAYRWPIPDKHEGAELSLEFRDLPGVLTLRDQAATSFRNNSKHLQQEHLRLLVGKEGVEAFWLDPTGLLMAEVKGEGAAIWLAFTFQAEPVKTYTVRFKKLPSNTHRQVALNAIAEIERLGLNHTRGDSATASS